MHWTRKRKEPELRSPDSLTAHIDAKDAELLRVTASISTTPTTSAGVSAICMLAGPTCPGLPRICQVSAALNADHDEIKDQVADELRA